MKIVVINTNSDWKWKWNNFCNESMHLETTKLQYIMSSFSFEIRSNLWPDFKLIVWKLNVVWLFVAVFRRRWQDAVCCGRTQLPSLLPVPGGTQEARDMCRRVDEKHCYQCCRGLHSLQPRHSHSVLSQHCRAPKSVKPRVTTEPPRWVTIKQSGVSVFDLTLSLFLKSGWC